jgi:hypothetical protein
MWSLSRWHNRQSSTPGERRRAQGSLRQRLAFRPTLAAREDRRRETGTQLDLTACHSPLYNSGGQAGPRAC